MGEQLSEAGLEKVRREMAADSRRYEPALLATIDQLQAEAAENSKWLQAAVADKVTAEAALDAVRKLPEKWRDPECDEPTCSFCKAYNFCADELEAELGKVSDEPLAELPADKSCCVHV